MREIRPSGSEGGGTEFNRFSLPLSDQGCHADSPVERVPEVRGRGPRAPGVRGLDHVWLATAMEQLRSGPFEGPAIVKPPALRGVFTCAEHVRQLGGESPLYNLTEAK